MRFDQTARRAVHYVLRLLGLPYRWAGDDPMAGFDCSGVVNEMLKSVGYMDNLEDANAQDLYKCFKKTDKAMPGVLAFFGTGPDKIIHVGICINENQMVEAGGGGRKTLTVQDAIDQNAYVRIRPIESRRDFVGFADPFTELPK